jgi:hypothetical protein
VQLLTEQAPLVLLVLDGPDDCRSSWRHFSYLALYDTWQDLFIGGCQSE